LTTNHVTVVIHISHLLSTLLLMLGRTFTSTMVASLVPKVVRRPKAKTLSGPVQDSNGHTTTD